jgi:hypothetical protein
MHSSRQRVGRHQTAMTHDQNEQGDHANCSYNHAFPTAFKVLAIGNSRRNSGLAIAPSMKKGCNEGAAERNCGAVSNLSQGLLHPPPLPAV